MRNTPQVNTKTTADQMVRSKSKVPDLPGQLCMTTAGGSIFARKPDEACSLAAAPLAAPVREIRPIDQIHQLVGEDGTVTWVDTKGNVVGYGDEHPYRKGQKT